MHVLHYLEEYFNIEKYLFILWGGGDGGLVSTTLIILYEFVEFHLRFLTVHVESTHVVVVALVV